MVRRKAPIAYKQKFRFVFHNPGKLVFSALFTNPRRPSGHQELLEIYRARW